MHGETAIRELVLPILLPAIRLLEVNFDVSLSGSGDAVYLK